MLPWRTANTASTPKRAKYFTTDNLKRATRSSLMFTRKPDALCFEAGTVSYNKGRKEAQHLSLPTKLETFASEVASYIVFFCSAHKMCSFNTWCSLRRLSGTCLLQQQAFQWTENQAWWFTVPFSHVESLITDGCSVFRICGQSFSHDGSSSAMLIFYYCRIEEPR